MACSAARMRAVAVFMAGLGLRDPLRLRLFSAAGRLVRGGRRLRLRLAERWPWAGDITATVTRLQARPPADQPEPPLRPGKETTRGRGTPPTGATAGQPGTARI
jgi:hypothetical protein